MKQTLNSILQDRYQIAICFMFFLLIVRTAFSLFEYNKEKDAQIKELEAKHKKTLYLRFVEVTNFEPDLNLFSMLNDEMIALLFNVASKGYIDRVEFESIYERFFGGDNYNQKSFLAFYPNWISIKYSFKTQKINSKVFFKMFFKK